MRLVQQLLFEMTGLVEKTEIDFVVAAKNDEIAITKVLPEKTSLAVADKDLSELMADIMNDSIEEPDESFIIPDVSKVLATPLDQELFSLSLLKTSSPTSANQKKKNVETDCHQRITSEEVLRCDEKLDDKVLQQQNLQSVAKSVEDSSRSYEEESVVNDDTLENSPQQVTNTNDSGFDIDNDISVVDSVNAEHDSNSEQQKNIHARPRRLCIYCGKMRHKLTRHLRLKHKEEDRVKNALQCNKRHRVKIFAALRWEGIIAYNKTQAELPQPVYQSEKSGKSKKALTRCSNCNITVVKRHFSRHRKVCSKTTNKPVQSIPTALFEVPEETSYCNGFKRA